MFGKFPHAAVFYHDNQHIFAEHLLKKDVPPENCSCVLLNSMIDSVDFIFFVWYNKMKNVCLNNRRIP